MKLKYVKLKNFGPYGDNETTFELEGKSPTLIVANNGCGKSMIINAIIFALYGKTLTKIDSIVNRKTKKNCKIDLGFTIGKDNYSILRYRLHEEHGNKLYLFKNKKDISLKNIGDTEILIQDIIQINYEVFKSAIVLSPEIYTSFLRTQNSNRLKVIENVFTLGFINDYAAVLKELRKPLLTELESIKVEKGKANSVLETIENSISSYKENAIATLQLLKIEKEKSILRLERVKEELLEFEKIDIVSEKNKLEAAIKNEITTTKISKEKNRKINIDELLNSLSIKKQEFDNLSKIDILEEKDKVSTYNQIKDNNNKIQSIIENLNGKIREISLIEESIQNKRIEIIKKEKEIQIIKDHIDKCSLCGQPVSASFNNNLISKKIEECILLKKEEDEISLKMEGFNRESLDLEIAKKMSEIKTIPDRPKYSLEELNHFSEKISQILFEIQELESNIKNANSINENVERVILDYAKEIIDVESSKYTKEFIDDLEETITAIKKEIIDTEKAIEITEEKAKSVYDRKYVEEMDEKRKKVSKLLEKINKKLSDKNNEDKHYEVLAQLLSNKDNGFKKYVIDKLIPVFNKHINFYISFFFDNQTTLEFDKELTPKIRVDEVEVELESFSSGQKTRLELSIMFALFMMVKTFFSSTVNLMFLDEILDMHLDEKGVKGVFDIIESLSKNNNIFIISHRDLYKDRVKHKIELEMVDEITRVVFK